MTDDSEGPAVLVPINAAEREEPPLALVELLSPLRLIVLGYYPVPDQATAEQLRKEYGEEAENAVASVTGRFAEQGADVDSVVVFTRDRTKTIDRVASERGADAVLTAGSIGDSLDRVLVPLRGDENLERIVLFSGDLLLDNDAAVTLFNVAETDEAETQGEFLLRGAVDRLEEHGLDPDRLEWKQERSDSPGAAIAAAAEAYDLLVVGESEPSLTERILGAVTTDVIDKTSHPVLVVRSN